MTRGGNFDPRSIAQQIKFLSRDLSGVSYLPDPLGPTQVQPVSEFLSDAHFSDLVSESAELDS